jgi:ribosomal protein L32
MSGHGKRGDGTSELGPLEYSYCPVTNKKRFRTRAAAKRHRRGHPAKQLISLYECEHCGGIHMTSQRPS